MKNAASKQEDSRYISTERYTNEADIWRDAWSIADPGASNPVAVARTLFKASSFLNHQIGTDGVRNHPALRLIAAQLASLYNVNADGGGGLDDEDSAFITSVKSMVDKLERFQDVCLTCGAFNDFPCRDKGAQAFRMMDHDGRPQTQNRDFTAYDKVVEQ
jgi:hypothetical protein